MYKKIVLIVIFLVSILLIYIPSFRLDFLLIDDGQIVQNSKTIVSSLKKYDFNGVKNIIFEPKEGRVRPMYWIIQAGLSVISFYNPSLMHGVRVLLFTITTLFVYLILKSLKIDSFWAWVGTLIFGLNFQNIENYYRLGPAEAFLGILYLLSLYLLIKNKNLIYVFVTLFLGSLVKETFFLITIPFLFVGFVYKNIKFKIVGLWGLVLGGLVFLVKINYGTASGYSQNYHITIPLIMENLKSYILQINFSQFPFLIFGLLVTGYIVFFRKGYKNSMLIILILNFILQLIVLTPWIYVLGRYLILVNLSLALIYGIVFDELWKTIHLSLSNNSGLDELFIANIKYLAIFLLFSFVFIRNVFPLANFQLWETNDSRLTYNILHSLAQHVSQNETVYVNYKKGDDNIEIYLETGWHLKLFWNRPDIKFLYLDNDSLCTNVDRIIFDRKSTRFIDRSVLVKNNLIIIDSGKETYSPINYGVVRNSFLSGQKLSNWFDNYDFDWTVFKQKPGTCIKI